MMHIFIVKIKICQKGQLSIFKRMTISDIGLLNHGEFFFYLPLLLSVDIPMSLIKNQKSLQT